MIFIFLIGILSILFYYYFVKPLNYWREKGVKQSNPVPFFGDNMGTTFRRMNAMEMIDSVYKMYPKSRYVGFYEFCKPMLIIRDPELIKQIGVKEIDHFTDHRSFIDPEIDPLWGKNLFALRGQAWKEMRATLSGSFTSSKMRHMFGLMKEASENLVKHFQQKDEAIIEVEMKDIFTRFANDVIATTAFGIKVDSLKNKTNDFYLMVKKATDFKSLKMFIKSLTLLLLPRISKYFKLKFFDNDVRHFFTDLVNDTIKTREEQGIVRPDMINILLEAKKGNFKSYEDKSIIDSGFAVVQESELKTPVSQQKQITNADITSQVMIFFFAGFETVSTLMCFMAYELAVNEEVQKKLRKEIVKTNEECKGNVTYEVLLKMKYLDMVITETLRLWPPFLFLDRVCTKPYTIEPESPDEAPVDLKVGDVTLFLPYSIQRDPEHYSDPDKFDPERFSDENKDNLKPYTFIPFGVGPRNCIGSRFALLEVKAVFYNILMNFQIVPTAKSQIPLKISKKSFNLAAEDGYWFGLKRI